MNKEVLNLAQLNDTYKSKWENEFGNVSNSSLETMWSDMFSTFNLTVKKNSIRRRGIVDVSKEFKKQHTEVFSSTMSSGKSTALLHYLSYGFDTRIHKALIVVELKKTATEFEYSLRDRGAVAVHSGTDAYTEGDMTYTEVPKRDLEDNLDAPILIITHARLVQMLHKGTEDIVFDNYDLVVIDEEISTYQHIELSYHSIGKHILDILKNNFIEDNLIETMFNKLRDRLSKLRDTEGNGVHVINKYTEGRDYALDWSTLADRLEDIIKREGTTLSHSDKKILMSKVIAFRTISKQGRMKVVYLQKKGNQIGFNVMIDFMPIHISKVILDGTASINDTYKFLKKHIGDDVVDIKKYHTGVRDFKNMTINWYSMPTGKNSLSIDDTKLSKKDYDKKLPVVIEGLKNLVSNTISRFSKEEKVLFIIHKDNAIHLEPLLKGTNYSFLWWGRHVGTNAYKEYNKIVVYGLNYLPENTYTAQYFSTYTARTKLDLAPIDDFKGSRFAVDILQAIMRGAGRKVIDLGGNCSTDVEVILSLPNNPIKNNILARMEDVLPNVKVVEIQDGAKPVKLDTVNTNNINTLLTRLKVLAKVSLENIAVNYTKEEMASTFYILPKEVDITSSNLNKLLLKGKYSEANTQLLLTNGWVYVSPTKVELKEAGLSGNTKKVFKYIGIFLDEGETTLDSNGNEF